jgi:uncharacterized protein
MSGDERPEIGAILHELTSARVPWLALARAGSGRQDRHLRTMSDVTVIDLADPHVPPVTVNPFEPEPGYPVQAHADRLAGLLEAAFGPAEPVAAAVRAGLRRAYADCGWDALTGITPPGARTTPAVPAFRQLTRATLAAIEDLDYDGGTRDAVRGFVHARLEPLWTGPAGLFLEGGHPADVGRLVRGNVLLLVGGLADDEGTDFLTGALLARIAERLRLDDRGDQARAGWPGGGNRPAPGEEAPPGLRLAVVTAPDLAPGSRPGAAGRPRAAGWFTRLHQDLRAAGAEILVARESRGSGPASAGPASAGPGTAQDGAAGAAVLCGRRSAACGAQCRRHRPCSWYELHAAGLLARDDERAWFRLWVQTLLLAFLVGRPLPRVPAELRSGWRALSPRSRECVLATVVDRAVTVRAAALRRNYDPGRLMSVVAVTAGRMLDETTVPFRAGPVWVIPQLRWLHEIERLHPRGHTEIQPDDIAPPLDFGLAGLPDWPGIRIRDRFSALGRHSLSMASPRNRRLACIALLGEDQRAGLDGDLAAAAVGIHPASRLPYAARLMGVGADGPEPGWLEIVLSWPDRINQAAWDTDVRPALTG